jgi:hypothetical protein
MYCQDNEFPPLPTPPTKRPFLPRDLMPCQSMSDQLVDRWKQAGSLYLWRYAAARRDYEGWHLTADADACRSILDLLDRMLAAPYSSRKEISLGRVAEGVTRVVGCNAPVRPATTLILVAPRGERPEEWSITAAGNRVTLWSGQEGLRALRAGLEAIERGEGDYSFGAPPLWFWWHLGTV